MIDSHIHSCFSPDSSALPEEIIKSAISQNACYIAFADHMDKMNSVDIENYVAAISKLKEQFKSKIYIAVGIECGYNTQNAQKNANLLSCKGLEFIINSVHDVDGSDCYYQTHYEGKTKQQTYCKYFEAVLESLDASYPYHSIGHLSYITRTAPYPDSSACYDEFRDYYDAILKKLIEKNIIMELNTSVYGSKSLCLPSLEIVKRYIELGGENITFASDAHGINRLFDKYNQVSRAVSELGIKYWTVIKNNALAKIKI